jgi:hypothetical protein
MSSQAMNKQEMNEQEQRKLADLLQRSLPPMNPELDRDLWPKMLQRIMLHRIMLHRINERARDRHWLAVLFHHPRCRRCPGLTGHCWPR